MKVKILIADDDILIRESLNIILGIDEELQIISVVENGLQAVEQCKSQHIDVALLDVRMPLMNGVEATNHICKHTSTKVLILTTFDEDEYIKEAILNGAKGYILKNNSPEEIKNAIKCIYKGNSVMGEEILERLKNGVLEKNVEYKNNGTHELKKYDFTERELQVIEEVSKGLSNKEISEKLFISEGTVKNYISFILDKTGLKHRTQIAIFYLKGGVLPNK